MQAARCERAFEDPFGTHFLRRFFWPGSLYNYAQPTHEAL